VHKTVPNFRLQSGGKKGWRTEPECTYDWDPGEQPEKLLEASGAKIEHSPTGGAYYNPTRGTIDWLDGPARFRSRWLEAMLEEQVLPAEGCSGLDLWADVSQHSALFVSGSWDKALRLWKI